MVGSFSSVGPALRSRTAGWTPPPRMDGKLVLVTGATSGLGLATAKGVAALGAAVVLTARGHDRAERAVAQVRGAVPGAEVSYLLADMGEFDQVRNLADDFLTTHDRLDVLIHNAGALNKERTVSGSGTELDGGLAGRRTLPSDRPSVAGAIGRHAVAGDPGLFWRDVHAEVRPRHPGDGT